MTEKKEISQKIVNYAIWYYLKYFPSVWKVRQKLTQKFWPESEKGKKYWGIFDEDIDYILKEKMWNIIVEKEIIASKIQNYIDKGKNLNYIKSKLREKLFVEEEYMEILQNQFNCDNQSILNFEKIYKQIIILYKKNKSKNYIKQKFVERPFDAEWVESILNEVFVEWEMESLKTEFHKIIKTPLYFWENWNNEVEEYVKKYVWWLSFQNRQKLTQKLLGKWFWYQLIRELFEEVENY